MIHDYHGNDVCCRSPTVKGERELFPFSRKMDISSFTLISRPGFYFEYESELNYAFIDTIYVIFWERKCSYIKDFRFVLPKKHCWPQNARSQRLRGPNLATNPIFLISKQRPIQWNNLFLDLKTPKNHVCKGPPLQISPGGVFRSCKNLGTEF